MPPHNDRRNKRSSRHPNVYAFLVILAVLGFAFVRQQQAPSNTADVMLSSIRGDDADDWNALHASCIEYQSGPGRGKKDDINKCTEYADNALLAARREKLSLAAYIEKHRAELQWLPQKTEQATHE